MIAEHLVKSPSERRRPPSKHPESSECGLKNENLFSPRFRSVAAMAGWDEEALLIASRIVEDTPDRQMKQRKLAVESDVRNLKTTPPPDSTRKIKVHRTNPVSIPVTVLDLEENDSKPEPEQQAKGADAEGSTATPIPCIDRLREELSCAICLEICYEPSTTTCGHSFCKKCLISAADKCGRDVQSAGILSAMGGIARLIQFSGTQFSCCFPKRSEPEKQLRMVQKVEAKVRSGLGTDPSEL